MFNINIECSKLKTMVDFLSLFYKDITFFINKDGLIGQNKIEGNVAFCEIILDKKLLKGFDFKNKDEIKITINQIGIKSLISILKGEDIINITYNKEKEKGTQKIG